MMDKLNNKVYKYQDHVNNNILPGDPSGSPDDSFSSQYDETLVFIDEEFLSKLSKYFGGGKYLKFDRITFSINLGGNKK